MTPSQEKSSDWFSKIVLNPVKISFCVLILSIFVVVGLTFYFEYYGPGFLKNILIEAHGMLFDILVIGLFILWLNNKGEQRKNVQMYIDQIDDFRGWESEEAIHRIKGNILRLNKLGISKIPLFECHLEGSNLSGANLKAANLAAANLKGCVLRQANLEDANLEAANLQAVSLQGANLRGANLIRTNLIGANLMGTLLSGANLSGANLSGVTIFAFDQICQALTLYEATLDDDLRKGIEEKCSDLLKEPKAEYVKYVNSDGSICMKGKDIKKLLSIKG